MYERAFVNIATALCDAREKCGRGYADKLLVVVFFFQRRES